MKSYILVLLFFLCTVMTPAQGGEENETSVLYLTLQMTSEETSKDSNRQETTIMIRDRVLEYSYRHSGYPGKRQIKRKHSLSKKQEGELISYIQENGLNRTIEEIRPTEGIGIAVDLKLEIVNENQKSAARIVGRSKIWSTESAQKTNLENLDYLSAVHSLLVFFNNQFGFDFVL